MFALSIHALPVLLGVDSYHLCTWEIKTAIKRHLQTLQPSCSGHIPAQERSSTLLSERTTPTPSPLLAKSADLQNVIQTTAVHTNQWMQMLPFAPSAPCKARTTRATCQGMSISAEELCSCLPSSVQWSPYLISSSPSFLARVRPEKSFHNTSLDKHHTEATI